MPTIRINGVDYVFEKSYRKEIEDSAEVKSFKESKEYKNQTYEEILDILIKKHEQMLINIEDEWKEQEEKYESARNNLRREKYSNAYKSEYEKKFDKENKLLHENYGNGAKELYEKFVNDKFYKVYTEKYNTTDLKKLVPAIYENEFSNGYIPEVREWISGAIGINAYTKNLEIDSFDTTKEQYVKDKIDKRIEKREDEIEKKVEEEWDKDPKYQKIGDETDRAHSIYQERREVELGMGEAIQQLKFTDIGRKAQVANVLKARENLAKEYYKTSLGSRIARWMPFIPRSWSKAGKIQDQLDKIDKAIKDAGFDKREVNTIKKDIKDGWFDVKEEVDLQNDQIIGKDITDKVVPKDVIKEDITPGRDEIIEINKPETTTDLQDIIKNDTVLTESKNDLSKAVDNNKTLQKDEIVSQ